MANKLYVGNLSWSTDNTGLETAFSEYGEVEDARVITDRESDRSRGFGFVTFKNEDDAEKALAMDGQDLDGRPLKVNFARDKED